MNKDSAYNYMTEWYNDSHKPYNVVLVRKGEGYVNSNNRYDQNRRKY